MDFSQFHFIRPEWFGALIPAAILFWAVLRTRNGGAGSGWVRHVDAHLLRHLAIAGAAARPSRRGPALAAVGLLVTITALAGPTWHKAEVPSFTGGAPTVAVLSLTQSMNADDLAPSRLKRAVHKLRDILDRTKGDDRALVIYSDIPFVAAPLTNDASVIEQMLPELSTRLMPVLGNRPDLALAEAQAVLERAEATRGNIILMADSAADADATVQAARTAKSAGFTVSVLALGTEDGATLQTADGRAIATRTGEQLTTALDVAGLERVAQAGGGRYASVTATDVDLNHLLPVTDDIQNAGEQQDFRADSWVDMGYWLLVLPVLLLPLAFRRGLVLALGLIAFGLTAQPRDAQAGTWDDLWATPDQQGKAAFDAGNYDAAARRFEAPGWQASSAYRAGDFVAAARGFSGSDYNRGNALAKSGRFEEALAAYEQVLTAQPDDEDARFNRDLVRELLDQQQQDQQQSEQSPDQQQSDSSGDAQQSSDGSGDQSGTGSEGEQPDQPGAQQVQRDQQGQQDGQQPEPDSAGDQPGESGAQSTAQTEQPQRSGDQTSEHGTEHAEQNTENNAAGPGDDSRQQAGAEQPADARAGDHSRAADAEPRPVAETPGVADDANGDEGSTLSDMLSEMLSGYGENDDGAEPVAAGAPAAQATDQAVEQQLRRVPDDPSGLLRARIRQHYARLGAAN